MTVTTHKDISSEYLLQGLEDYYNFKLAEIYVWETTIDLTKEAVNNLTKMFAKSIADRQKIAIEDISTSDLPISTEFVRWTTDACVEFCNSHGLIDVLRRCNKHINIIFKNIDTVSADYDCFDEEDGQTEGHIAIRVSINSNLQTAMQDYNNWIKWKISNLSIEQRKYFTLTFHRIAK